MSSEKKNTEIEKDVVEEEDEEEEEEDEEEEEEEEEEEDQRIPVDLSQNEIYRGVCTLLEDDDGNNILEYISLLHTELIGINKSLDSLRSIKKDMARLADCAEIFLNVKKEKKDVTDVSTVERKKKAHK